MSVIAQAVKHMLAAGMSAEAVVAAVEDMEGAFLDMQPQEISARKERNRRYYEKKKASESVLNASENIPERLNSDDSDAKVSPLDPPLFSPTPPINPPLIPPAKPARQKPKDLQATTLDDLKAWMAEKQAEGFLFAGIEPRIELEKCKNHFLGKSRTIGTAREWMLNAVKYAKERGSGGKLLQKTSNLPQVTEWSTQ